MTDNRTWKDIAGVMHQACIDKNPELAVDVYEDFSKQQIFTNGIVARLRTKFQGQLPICAEAADEIERLRKLITHFVIAEEDYQSSLRDAYENDESLVLEDSWKKAWKALYDEADKYEW